MDPKDEPKDELQAHGQTEGALALQAGLEAPQVTREQRRSRRKPEPMRARTISVKRMTKRELELGRLLYPETDEASVRRCAPIA